MSTGEIILSVTLVVVSIVSFLCIIAQAAHISNIKDERDAAVNNGNRLRADIQRHSEALARERETNQPLDSERGLHIQRRAATEAQSMYAINDNLTAAHHYMGVTSEGDPILRSDDHRLSFDSSLRAEFDPAFVRGAQIHSNIAAGPRERNQWTGQDRKRS